MQCSGHPENHLGNPVARTRQERLQPAGDNKRRHERAWVSALPPHSQSQRSQCQEPSDAANAASAKERNNKMKRPRTRCRWSQNAHATWRCEAKNTTRGHRGQISRPPQHDTKTLSPQIATKAGAQPKKVQRCEEHSSIEVVARDKVTAPRTC